MPEKALQHAEIDVTIGGRDAVVKVDPFKGRDYLGIHYYYFDSRDGQRKYSSNGINIPLVDAKEAIRHLAQVYLEATGEVLCVVPEDEDGA